MRELRYLFCVLMISKQVGSEIAIGEKVDGVADPHRQGIVAVIPRKLLDRVVAEIHYLDGVRAAAAIMSPHAGFVPIGSEGECDFLISNTSSVGRIGRAESARHWQRFRKAAVNTDCPKTKIRLLRRTVPHRSKDHTPSIGRPAARAIQAGMVRQTFRIAARRGNDVNVSVPRDG